MKKVDWLKPDKTNTIDDKAGLRRLFVFAIKAACLCLSITFLCGESSSNTPASADVEFEDLMRNGVAVDTFITEQIKNGVTSESDNTKFHFVHHVDSASGEQVIDGGKSFLIWEKSYSKSVERRAKYGF